MRRDWDFDQILGRRARVDFHLHSYASNTTDYYASNSLAIPESYSDPIETWRLLKSRGMDLVTLTDHNSIAGVKEMLDAGLEDVFISAEMTATFPEDGCNIHVTAANISEEEFAEIDRLRPNLYEMLAYLDERIRTEAERPDGRRIAYFMTHPLMSTKNRPYGREGALSIRHIERAMLLFECIETQNGARARSGNDLTAHMVESLDEKRILELAAKHELEPRGAIPWRKAVVGGSDDHSGINPGRTWTEFEYHGERPRPNDVIDSIRRRSTTTGGMHGGPVTLAHALVKLVYDGQNHRQRAEQATRLHLSDPINLLLGFAFEKPSASLRSRAALRLRIALQTVFARPFARLVDRRESFERVFLGEAQTLLADESFRGRLTGIGSTDDKIFLIISTLLDRLFLRYAERIRSQPPGDMVRTIKESIALVSSNLLVSLPYFVSYANFGTDRLLNRDVRRAFDLRQTERLLLVTDTLFDVNGVALTIRKILREAERRGIDLTVVTALAEHERAAGLADPEIAALVAQGRLKIFTALASADLPEYQELQLRLIPFLDLLRFAQEGGFSKVQISTPGPVGVLGLLAAKLLGLETAATYHTSFPEYVEEYTKDVSLEALAWRYMVSFYHWVDEVVVPSRYIAQLLHKRGLRNRNLLVLDRWVDLERFHPRHRTPGFWTRFGLDDEAARVKLVYVGRIGAEKNLDVLAHAYRSLHAEHPEAHLVIIGGGPYRGELEALLEGLPVTFTGYLGGDDLSRAIASADAKLFPSTTDTWGNAPLEAQASGLPVVVSDRGGPQELMEDGVTGFRVRGGDVQSLLAAMRALMDRDLRERMGHDARAFVEANDVPEPYSAILESTIYRGRRRSEKLLAGLLRHEDDAASA
ncbi:MAG: glycosyltransferase [Deltaproteobacteria bacterium]|nr:glycosyltransferase [Deltaproteobacteria bacterium]